jgi:hypothetical protein
MPWKATPVLLFQMVWCTILCEVHNISIIPDRYDWIVKILQYVKIYLGIHFVMEDVWAVELTITNSTPYNDRRPCLQ